VSVFINCPFDKEYRPLLRVALFTTFFLGLKPRTSLERGNAGEPRIGKIMELIKNSKYGIHDLSRIKSSAPDEFARLNMPFELGLDIAVQHISKKGKLCLVVETEPYRYQKALSDLSGNDIKAHKDDPKELMKVIREWIHQNHHKNHGFPLLESMWGTYCDFKGKLKEDFKLSDDSDDAINDVSISEYMAAMAVVVKPSC
jgi:hypothetical protein